jgi:RNA polymerase sigma factor FliA
LDTVHTLDPISFLPANSPEADQDALVLRHLPQVQIVARRLAATLPEHVALTDLIGAGVLGLIDALSKFDPARDASLSTYAQFRIRGAILDSLRSQDWAPRRVRLFSRRVADARTALSASLQRVPTESEIASHLDTSLEDYQSHLTECRLLDVQSFVDPAEEGSPGPSLENVPSLAPDPLQKLLGQEEASRLSGAVEALPPNERQVIALYYLEELTMREVGLVMGIGESRVCQIHRAALDRLKRSWDRRSRRRS